MSDFAETQEEEEAGPAPVALVTGAGQRVGRVIALALAERGFRVAVHYNRSRAGAEATVSEIREMGAEAFPVQSDLRRPEAPDSLVAAVKAQFGALHVLVNSAAGMERTSLGSISPAQFDAIIALNLRAPFLLAQAASREMQDGAIINIADHMAEEPWADYSVHGVSKAGVIAMTRHLAAALAPHIRVNAVAPGFVLAPEGYGAVAQARFANETPLGRLGSPEDVAHAVLYLLDAGYVTGETLFVDGGRRVRP
ncbi:MAG TPA: SDR family oxidoreductase [Gemmatimonadaceae bacterium]|nr:SDR family oxidoreductase [Gemmatimonadaceae bacterium]